MGPYGGSLAQTGGVVIGSYVISQSALVGVALGLLIGGALLVRLSFRRGKVATER